MSQMTDYLENKLVDHIFRARSFTAPTSIKIKLYTAAPGETGGGTEVSTSGTNYAALTVACSDANFQSTQGTTTAVASSGTGGQTANGAQQTFGTPSGSWGTVTHVALTDQSDNMLFYGALTAQKNVNNGDPAPYFAAAALTVTFA